MKIEIDKNKNSLHDESDDGSGVAFEVVEKFENDYSDLENGDIVEYLQEEELIEEYQVSQCSEEEVGQDLETQHEQDIPKKYLKLQNDKKVPISPIQANTTTTTKNSRNSSLFTESECEIFGVFIANEMKSFDTKKRKLFKKKVLQLLLDMDDD